jgi:hypothetical protein
VTGGKQGFSYYDLTGKLDTFHTGWLKTLVDEAGRAGNTILRMDFCSCKKMKEEQTITVLDSSGYSTSVFEGENNVVLISLPGFAKNQEDEISDFKMSHWKQVVFKEHTLKFKPGDNEAGRKQDNALHTFSLSEQTCQLKSMY